MTRFLLSQLIIILLLCFFYHPIQGQDVIWLTSDTSVKVLTGNTCLKGDWLVIPLHIEDTSQVHLHSSKIAIYHTATHQVSMIPITSSISGFTDVVEFCSYSQDAFWGFGRRYDHQDLSVDLLIMQFDTLFKPVWDTVIVNDTFYSEFFQSVVEYDSAFYIASNSILQDTHILNLWRLKDQHLEHLMSSKDVTSVSFWRQLYIDEKNQQLTVKQLMGERLILNMQDYSVDSVVPMHSFDFEGAPFISQLDSAYYLEIFALRVPSSHLPDLEWQTAVCTTNIWGEIQTCHILDPICEPTEVSYPNATMWLSDDTMISCVMQSNNFPLYGYSHPFAATYPFQTQIIIYAHSPTGDLYWKNNFSLQYSTYPISIIKSKGGELILTGVMVNHHKYWGYQITPSRPFILRLDMDGNFVGLEEAAANDAPSLKVFPNPSDGLITLQSNTLFQSAKSGEVEVLNVQGVVLLSRQLSQQNLNMQLDLSSFPPGLYLIRIIQEGKIVATQKVLLY